MGIVDRIASRLGFVRRPEQSTPRSVGRRAFEAAETPAYGESWNPRLASINDDLAREIPSLRARAAWLSRNNEWARRYQLLQRANVHGSSGIRLQMRVTKRSGEPNQVINDRIEAAWLRWGRRGACDPSGRSWRQLERIILDGVSRDGEILGRYLSGFGPHRFGIQLMNPSVLDVNLRRDWQGRRVRMGVEIDDAGAPIAYWLRAVRTGDTDSFGMVIGAHVRVPASEILHRFVDEEIDQLRGYPALSVGARRLWLAHEFETAAAVASRNAAQRLGFFTTPNGEAPDSIVDTLMHARLEEARAKAATEGRTLTAAEIEAIQAEAMKFSTSVPGQYDVLPEGVQFSQYQSDYPNVNHAEYVNHAIRGWSGGQGVSYVTVGNNLEAVNYSSARVGILDEREQWKMVQQWIIEEVYQSIFERWLERAMLADPMLAVLSLDRIDEYCAAATWQPRRWQGIDPAKEAESNERNIKNRLTSRRRIILERGDDPDEIAAEIAEEEALYGPISDSTTVASTPDPADDATPPPARARHLRAL